MNIRITKDNVMLLQEGLRVIGITSKRTGKIYSFSPEEFTVMWDSDATSTFRFSRMITSVIELIVKS